MSYLGLLWKNLGRRKLRTTMTVFSIFMAFLIYVAMATFEGALNSGIELSGADRLVTVNKISFIQSLPISYYNRIKATPGVDTATYADWFGGYYQDPKKIIPVFGVDPSSYLEVYPEIKLKPDEREKWLGDRTGAIVGRNLAHLYGWKTGDRIPISSNIYSQHDGSQVWELNVDGIFFSEDEQFDTTFMLFHHEYFDESRSFGNDTIGWLVIRVDDPQLNEQVSKAIDRQFENSPYETKTSTEKAFNKAFLEQFGNISFIIISVVSAAFFTILLITGNTMMLALRERTSEIAVMRTLGFASSTISGLVLAESILLAMVGGIPGLAVAWLIIRATKDALRGFLPPLSVSPEIVIQAFAMMIALGLLTGLVPAYNAMRVNVVTALGRR